MKLRVAALQEAISVNASAAVLGLSSGKIGVNVSPDELQHLPVNGRNFANLMTLALGATSDGNGGWASVPVQRQSNQQNYLSYDGVDGTYVWDASCRSSSRDTLALGGTDSCLSDVISMHLRGTLA